MTAIVPDTLQGALIISVIDFFLSFLIISGIGVVLSFFPLLNRVALLFNTSPKAAAENKVVEAEPDASEKIPPNEIAAIAAAVFVVMEGAPHHIIHIEPSPRRSLWAAEGRIAQHKHTVR